MMKLPQSNTSKATQSVRLRADVYMAARREAYRKRTKIVVVLDRVLRDYFKLAEKVA